MKRHAVCWDTGAGGFTSPDPEVSGVEVRVSGPGAAGPQTTDGSGVARFTGLAPGDYTVSATLADHDLVGDPYVTPTPSSTPTATVSTTRGPGGATRPASSVTLWVRRTGLECRRKHAALPGGAPTVRPIPIGLLWIPWGEPWILIVRDLLFLGALAASITGLAMGNFSVFAVGFVWVAILGAVIWGEAFGFATLFFAVFFWILATLTALVPTVAGALGEADPGAFPSLWATWSGFLLAVIWGRRDPYDANSWAVPIVGGAVGLTAALVILLWWALTGHVVGVGWWVADLLLGAVLGLAGGLFGHAFRNEGNTLETLRWNPGEFTLPFGGEHCCVQGLRGWVSHYDAGGQQHAYDFEMKYDEPVLCAREGHVIRVREGHTGTAAFSGNSDANEVYVKHRDGSVAMYLHLRQGGVTAHNPAMMALLESDPQTIKTGSPATATTQDTRELENGRNPVHIHPGQLIGGAGNVGISMFNHLHFYVRAPTRQDDGTSFPPGTVPYPDSTAPVRFRNAGAARHQGRCWSMRFYVSDTPHRGPVLVP